MRISDWSSDVCSSDLTNRPSALPAFSEISKRRTYHLHRGSNHRSHIGKARDDVGQCAACPGQVALKLSAEQFRSEEHTSELQSLMRISYAVFCLKKKNSTNIQQSTHTYTNLQCDKIIKQSYNKNESH